MMAFCALHKWEKKTASARLEPPTLNVTRKALCQLDTGAHTLQAAMKVFKGWTKSLC